ncbi:tyrosine-type recombinase/integrase [Nocardia sp. bgisy118]|uniref:tyrosine-type recombinase/integrase n=1 Tax=Nocardia sp. bgisy118 TaxID=3413786 RepID=UPI003F4A37F5
MTSTRTRASEADIAAAAAILERLNVTTDDLMATVSRPTVVVPTFAEYAPRVYAAMPPTRTRENYRSYWNKIAALWPDRRLDEPTTSELAALVNQIRQQRAIRRSDRGGKGVARAAVDALRCLYRHAVRDRLIDAASNPTTELDRSAPPRPHRRALPDTLLTDIYRVTADGPDPELHQVLIRLHIETACRRGGALALRPQDLDPTECSIRLREKGATERWQPVSPTLMSALQHLDSQRRPDPDDTPTHARNGRPISSDASQRLLRYRNGHPITIGCYDGLWGRIRAEVPAADILGISTHWLRHTTLKWVERNFGISVAEAYAGHAINHSHGATGTYTRAEIEEVAEALSWLTGEQHPLAPPADYGAERGLPSWAAA